jgi:uncharacterized protein (DUF1330 family)
LRRAAGPTFAPYGGRPIVVDGHSEVIEGMIHPKSVVVVEFESLDDAKRLPEVIEVPVVVSSDQRAAHPAKVMGTTCRGRCRDHAALVERVIGHSAEPACVGCVGVATGVPGRGERRRPCAVSRTKSSAVITPAISRAASCSMNRTRWLRGRPSRVERPQAVHCMPRGLDAASAGRSLRPAAGPAWKRHDHQPDR